jgi:hypothetical protein
MRPFGAKLKDQRLTQVVIAVRRHRRPRHAYELNFNVTLTLDAMTDISANPNVNSVTRISLVWAIGLLTEPVARASGVLRAAFQRRGVRPPMPRVQRFYGGSSPSMG